MLFLGRPISVNQYSVDTASDLPEALRKVAANHPELIISDVRLPRGSGEALYREVQRLDPDRARRIIFTGDGADAEAERFVREQGNLLLLKPYMLQQVERALHDALSN